MKHLKSIVLRRAVFALCLMAAVCPFVGVNAQSEEAGRWSTPQRISSGWWQTIAVDKQGNAHLTWYDSASSSDQVVRDALWYARRSLSGEWTLPNNVISTTVGGYTVRNAVAATSDGMVHVAYRAGISHFVASVFGLQAENATNWSVGHPVDDSGYYIDMLSDENNVLHLVASGYVDVIKPKVLNAEASPCALCYDLFYRRSEDGGLSWSKPYPFSVDPNTGTDRMNIFEGTSGRLYVTWDEGLDWYVGRGTAQDVRIAYSDDGGLTWSDPVILDGGALLERRPIQLSAAELRDGSVMAVWRYSSDLDRNIYYQLTTDMQTWTEPVPIEGLVARYLNDTPLDVFDMLTDRQGRVHLFAVGQPDLGSQANASLYHLIYQQGIWLAPQRIFYDPAMRPEWPRAVLGPSNDIHLSWFIRGIRENQQIRNEDFTRILQVYYSHFEGNLPVQVMPTFVPTVTPLPSPTPFQLFEPTPTPIPTARPIENSDTSPMQTRDNYAMQVLVGGTLFTMLFCAGLLAFLRLRQH